MLIKLLDHLKKVEILRRQYIGVVVDNEDPKRLGRVKCVITGMLSGETDVLPWVFPKNPAGQGGGGNNSSIEIPDIGSQLIIEFPFDDVYSPFYTGFWQSSETHQGGFDGDYPNTRGWQDSDGTYFRVNTARRTSDFYHASGSRVRHNRDGSIDIISPKGINLLSNDGKVSMRIDAIEGNIATTNRGVGTLAGSKTNIMSQVHEVNVGTVYDNSAGAREVKTSGGYKHVVGGGVSESIVSNKAVSVGGNLNETIVGKTQTIMGDAREEIIALGDDEKTLMAGDRKTTITLGNYKINLIAGDYDLSVTAGNIKFNTLAGKAEISNAVGKMTISETGDIEIDNTGANIKGTITGDLEIKSKIGMGDLKLGSDGSAVLSTLVSKLKIDAAGMVGIGSSAAELLDIVDKTLDAFINCPNLVMTGVGPSSPILPPAMTDLVAAKVLLALIKGSV